MNKGLTWISGIGVGAGFMYLFDPYAGNRRRALLRDKMISLASHLDDALSVMVRDFSNRTYGIVAEAMSGTRALWAGEEVPDEVLVERIRSKIGRVVSHPGSIAVTAHQGRVTLSGPILAREVDDLISAVSSVRGVTSVENRLEVHEQPEDVPGLQGGPARPGQPLDILQVYWAPTTRLLVGAAGGALVSYGVGRRDIPGVVLGIAGSGLLARAITNMEMKRLIGIGGGRRAVDIQKTIHINAPIERVFELWTNYENFPFFMRNVREVRDLGDGRSHWTVAGPAGTEVEWDAVITRLESNKVLAWKTVPGSLVEHAGIVHFQANPDGSTRAHIRLSYNPPAGALGHVVAALFGADPKSEMDEDLVRMKTFIETGKLPHDAAAYTETS